MEPSKPFGRSASYAPESQGPLPRSHLKVTGIYPLQIHYIKATFLQKRYRQCIQACRGYLDSDQPTFHPAQETVALFYLGLAHDSLARLMPSFSQAKVPTLLQAEEFYAKALESLSAINYVQCEKGGRAQEQSSSRNSKENYPFTDQLNPEPISDLSARLQRLTATPGVDTSYFSAVSDQVGESLSTLDQSDHETASELDSNTGCGHIEAPDDLQHPGVSAVSPTEYRGLHKTISSMSLLPKPQLQRVVSHLATRTESQLPREASRIFLNKTPPKIRSQHLLKPVRLGSPPKRYHLPSLPYMSRAQSTTKLPTLQTSSPATPLGNSKLATASEKVNTATNSPVSPLSPEETRAAIRNASKTVSPLSPATPISSPPASPSAPPPSSTPSFLDRDLSYPDYMQSSSPKCDSPFPNSSPRNLRQPYHYPVTLLQSSLRTHTTHLRTQLYTHLSSLRELIETTLAQQLDRDLRNNRRNNTTLTSTTSTTSTTPTSNTPTTTPPNIESQIAKPRKTQALPLSSSQPSVREGESHSDSQVEARERERRVSKRGGAATAARPLIASGRSRFDASRYRRLAEGVLGGL